MGEKLVVGPLNKGLRNDVTAFNIDNDSFPVLQNAYQWRGRVKRKRGTSELTRLARFLGTTDAVTGVYATTISPALLGTGYSSFVVGTEVFTDPGTSNPVTLITTGTGSGTLNRTTGALSITSTSNLNTAVNYYPGLPVMGIEDFFPNSQGDVQTVALDTDYAYNIPITYPYQAYSVSFYKNPLNPPYSYSGYTAKTTWSPINWNGEDYQQFWTTNYANSMWTTNGVTIPFSITNIGMQYKAITTVTVASATTATLTITAHGLVVGDFVFVNEVATTTGINFQTGYVTTVSDANNVIVTFPNATLATNGTGGIAQYLTSSADSTKDCIRWYDGDPTNATPPTPTTFKGWVNFCPPLSLSPYSIAGLPENRYYLVGARAILPFKDRLIFFGPVVQTSTAGTQTYLPDTIIYSQNGTPYYTASFASSQVYPTDINATTTFTPLLTPQVNTNSASTTAAFFQTATPNAYWGDQTGFGGFQVVGVDQPITTVSSNEDVLIVGFSTFQTRMTYTGNDIVPFNFFIINSELGSSSTFSAINTDQGVMTRGSRGYIITSQTGTQRIDLDIPDEVFQQKLTFNGNERFTAQRDFINEWVYFTYPNNQATDVYPNQTLQFNYRDNSWGVFLETYTTYGQFRKQSGQTWATLPADLTWASWNSPWNSGDSTLLNPEVIAGNQQGFVVFRNTEETTETPSLFISNISSNTVTSPHHSLVQGDYIIITGATGTIASEVNNKVFLVSPTVTTDTFQLDPPIGTGTYLGSGVITKCYQPLIQTRQFPMAWDMARKTRIGPQQYLFTKTSSGQITLLIYLSQDGNNAWNNSPVLPSPNSFNDALIYSTVLYTCPEGTNITGVTAPNINLNLVTASYQQQIWHRMNTSMIGDTVQIGFTLNDAQMRDPNRLLQFYEIELHSMVLDLSPSQLLC